LFCLVSATKTLIIIKLNMTYFLAVLGFVHCLLNASENMSIFDPELSRRAISLIIMVNLAAQYKIQQGFNLKTLFIVIGFVNFNLLHLVVFLS